MTDNNVLISLLPWMLMSIPMAFGNYFLARRLDRNPILWAMLSLVPILNFFFLLYIYYVLIFRVLDYLRNISERLSTSSIRAPLPMQSR